VTRVRALACLAGRPQVGVTKVVLAVNYKPEVMMEALKELEKKYNVQLVCSVEAEPMGTGE
jgi:mannose-1-phosphate guanylyltransferase